MNRVEELEKLQHIRMKLQEADRWPDYLVGPLVEAVTELTDLVSELAFKISMPPYTEIKVIEKQQ